jgi:hypothetical protein
MPPELINMILNYRRYYMFQDRIRKLEKQLSFPKPYKRYGYQDMFYLVTGHGNIRVCYTWYPFYLWFYMGAIDEPYEVTVYKWKMEVFNYVMKRKYEYETIF